MLKKIKCSEMSSLNHNSDIKFLVTSIDKLNPHITKEFPEKEKRERIKRNRSINPKLIEIQNLNHLSSNHTPKKKKSGNKKGKSVKFKVSQISHEDSIIPEENEINNETTNLVNFLENMLTKSHSKRKISKRNLIHLKVPNKLRKEIDLLSLDIVYPVENRYGLLDKYQQRIKESLKEISKLSFNSIFSCDNAKNVNYLIHEGTYDEKGNKKKLLLLDLDETLVHSEIRDKNNFHILNKLKDSANCYHKVFSYVDNNYLYYFDIFFRPYLFDFLHEIQNYFDIAIFTASSKGYADTIINYIDPSNTIFKFRLYRDACIPIQNYIYIKDLRIIRNYEPTNVVLMDNSLYSFINQPKNGMLLYSFYWDDKDDQLIKAKNFLIKHVYNAKDVRDELEKWYCYNESKKNNIILK